jgi:hypothetical protein
VAFFKYDGGVSAAVRFDASGEDVASALLGMDTFGAKNP